MRLFCLSWVVLCFVGLPADLWAQDARSDQLPPATGRTDSFEVKLQLLQKAWKEGDFDLARSLTHSLRDTVVQTQQEYQPPKESLVPSGQYLEVSQLPAAWQRWAEGWRYCKVLSLRESAGEERSSEPVEVALSFPADQVTLLRREVRLARVVGGRLVEVPCQVFAERRRGRVSSCQLLWLADSQPQEQQTLLVFYGNQEAELPEYPSDLTTEGEGFGLDITNSHFKAALSRQTGQLERLTLLREHGLELYSGGQGHGEPPGIDWAHDYVDEGHFQKLRVSLWDRCPEYEVIHGPLCTIVRRWGFPHSPVHPVHTPARLHVDVEYRFYAGLPWFRKIGRMKAVQDFRLAALRDDEWVFTGQSFTDKLWMDRQGRLHEGDVPQQSANVLWGIGFFNRDTRDAFVSLFLQHHGQQLPELKHSGGPTLWYRWHGSLWSRYPLSVDQLPAGAEVFQENVYLAVPYPEQGGPQEVERMRRCLMQPLQVAPGKSDLLQRVPIQADADQQDRLARTGEAGDQSALKLDIWLALQDCKDAQLYKADINVVDLGLIDDVRVRNGVVTVVMKMPHRGRPLAGYFVHGSISVHPSKSVPIRERLLQIPGVKQVEVRQTWHPAWSSNDLTDVGRQKLELDVVPGVSGSEQ